MWQDNPRQVKQPEYVAIEHFAIQLNVDVLPHSSLGATGIIDEYIQLRKNINLLYIDVRVSTFVYWPLSNRAQFVLIKLLCISYLPKMANNCIKGLLMLFQLGDINRKDQNVTFCQASLFSYHCMEINPCKLLESMMVIILG